MKKSEMRSLFAKARAAGLAAGSAAKCVPMIVRNDSILINGKPLEGGPWTVPDGPCGFAWVNVKPGTSSFARYLSKNGLARSSYYGGVDIWISDFEQSVTRKEACASAMAKIFAEAGIRASAMSRLD